jgi:hypothetical protein
MRKLVRQISILFLGTSMGAMVVGGLSPTRASIIAAVMAGIAMMLLLGSWLTWVTPDE